MKNNRENKPKELTNLSQFFNKINAKIKLLNLINKAKEEYDKCDFMAGEKDLIKALNVDCTNPTVLRGLGCIQQFKNNYSDAINYYSKALENSKQKELEYTLIGMAYYLQDNLDDAIKYFNLAIDENDDYEPAYEGRNQSMLENHLKILDLQESLKKYF